MTQEDIINFHPFHDPSLPINIWMVGRSRCDKTYRISRSDSELYSIEYVHEGSEVVIVDGKTYRAEKNDAYLLKKHTRHKYYSDKGDLIKNWIAFDGDIMEGLIHAYVGDDLVLIKNCNIGAYLQRAYEIAKEDKNDYHSVTEQLSVVILQILQRIRRIITSDERTLPEKLKDWIDLNTESGISIQEASAVFHYSRNSLINVFRKQYGETPYAYYIRKRLEAAKNYLDNTSLPIGEIAFKLGFADCQYFCTSFRKLYGVSPSVYRKGKRMR